MRQSLRTYRPLLIAIACVFVVVTACVAWGQRPSPGSLKVLTWNGDTTMDAAGSGVLEGKVVGDHACFWIDGPERTLLVMPHRYGADPDPLRLLDDHGHVVAQVGERIEYGGGNVGPTDGPCGHAESHWLVSGPEKVS